MYQLSSYLISSITIDGKLNVISRAIEYHEKRPISQADKVMFTALLKQILTIKDLTKKQKRLADYLMLELNS